MMRSTLAMTSACDKLSYAHCAGGISLQEVLMMSDSGLSDEIVARHIRTHRFNDALDTGDLIALRRQGVSDRIVASLQAVATFPARIAQTQIPVPTARPVILQDGYHALSYLGHPRWRYRHGYSCPPDHAFTGDSRSVTDAWDSATLTNVQVGYTAAQHTK